MLGQARPTPGAGPPDSPGPQGWVNAGGIFAAGRPERLLPGDCVVQEGPSGDTSCLRSSNIS